MTINYYGQMKDCKHNTRIMEVAYRDEEETLVLRTADLIEKKQHLTDIADLTIQSYLELTTEKISRT